VPAADATHTHRSAASGANLRQHMTECPICYNRILPEEEAYTNPCFHRFCLEVCANNGQRMASPAADSRSTRPQRTALPCARSASNAGPRRSGATLPRAPPAAPSRPRAPSAGRPTPTLSLMPTASASGAASTLAAGQAAVRHNVACRVLIQNVSWAGICSAPCPTTQTARHAHVHVHVCALCALAGPLVTLGLARRSKAVDGGARGAALRLGGGMLELDADRRRRRALYLNPAAPAASPAAGTSGGHEARQRARDAAEEVGRCGGRSVTSLDDIGCDRSLAVPHKRSPASDTHLAALYLVYYQPNGASAAASRVRQRLPPRPPGDPQVEAWIKRELQASGPCCGRRERPAARCGARKAPLRSRDPAGAHRDLC
jgi:hypothetical protein